MSCEIVKANHFLLKGGSIVSKTLLNVNLFCVSKSRLVWLKMVLNVKLKRCF